MISNNQNSNSSSSNTTGTSLRSDLISLYKNKKSSEYEEKNGTSQQSIPPSQEQSQAQSQAQVQARTQQSFTLRNPQTVLSHDPNQLSKNLKLSFENVLQLRNEMSNVIVMDPTVGNSNPICRTRTKTRTKTTTNGALIASAVTAKDLYKVTLSSSLSSSLSSLLPSISLAFPSALPYVLKTGSQELDKLLSSSAALLSSSSTAAAALSSSSISSNNNRIGHKRKRQQYQNNSNNNNNDDIQFGIQIGTITEICGISSSGKTQLALSIAANAIIANHIEERNNKINNSNSNSNNNSNDSNSSKRFTVHYIAGGGGSMSLISLARRFKQLCKVRLDMSRNSSSSNSNNNNNDSINDGVVFDRINFIPIGDNPYHLLTELNQIENQMKMNNYNNDENSNMIIIIDSISGCLSSYLYADGDGGVGASLMNEISLTLRRLSRLTTVMENDDVNQCAILITNGMVMDSNSNKRGYNNTNSSSRKHSRMYTHKPALGESWRAADVRLILHPVRHIFDEESDHESNNGRRGRRKTVSGLKVSKLAVVDARLEKHYDKSCCLPTDVNQGVIQFGIDTTGIVDFK